VTDTDPPNEVDDVERPANRLVVTPDTDTLREKQTHRHEQQLRDEKRDGEADEPNERRLLFSVTSPILSDTVPNVWSPSTIGG
jgi:hypothetical protein